MLSMPNILFSSQVMYHTLIGLRNFKAWKKLIDHRSLKSHGGCTQAKSPQSTIESDI